MLFARRKGTSLALACSTPFRAMSCGYVGFSDGWQDISAHKRMTWFYPEARDGNIALTGEIDLGACNGSFVLVLAFGSNPAEAGQRARASLLQDFDRVADEYVSQWTTCQSQCLDLGAVDESGFDVYRVSTAVLKTHQAKLMPGGMIASLSIPWGFSKGDDDLGGYHLVWPRDLVEAAGGLLAAGDVASVRQALFYLMCTQEADGHWPQNMWLDGAPYWSGVQMDETAFPILLADALRRMNELHHLDPWPMVCRAAGFPGMQRPCHRAGPLGRGRRLLTLYPGRRGRCPACRRGFRRRSRRDAGGRLPAGDGRHVEHEHRALDLRDRRRLGAASRGGGLLRAYRSTRGGGRCLTRRRLRSHQEPPSRREHRSLRPNRQSGCPVACQVWAAGPR